MKWGLVSVYLKRSLYQLNSRLMPAALMKHCSQQVQGIKMRGCLLKNFAIQGFSLSQMSPLVERYSLLELGMNGSVGLWLRRYILRLMRCTR